MTLTLEPAADQRVPLLRRLGRLLVDRRRAVLITGTVLLVVAAALGAGAQKALSLSRFEAPGSQSDRASEVLHREFGHGSPNMILLVTAKHGTVDDPAVAAAGQALATELGTSAGVRTTGSYWGQGNSPALASTDRTKALVTAWLDGTATESRERLADLSPKFTRETADVRIEVGGQDEVFRQVGAQARKDFLGAEAIVLPAVLLLLLAVYRRWSAAGLTIGVGLFSVLATLTLLRGVTLFTEVSTFAANLALVMGLGLGIDYSLFVISRFREESAAGHDKHTAVVRAVERAGRTVIFSGITVAISLLALFAFPFPFLRSFAYAGVFVVLTAIVGAVVLLPAALAAVGHRVLRPDAAGAGPVEDGRWYRFTQRVMARPLAFGTAVVALLLLLGAPFLGVKFGLPDERVLPAEATSRVVQQQIRDGFPARETDALQIVATGVADPKGTTGQTDAYAAKLSALPGVFQVDTFTGSYTDGRLRTGPTADSARFATGSGVWLTVIPEEAALAGDMPGLVGQVRDEGAPYQVQVGGFPADMTDFRSGLLSALPLVAGLILVPTFILLFLMTGSLLIPAKATVSNLLSLTVMFGALVWGFQDGNLAGLLDFTSAGSMEPSIPILMFCIAYGLSMDYEVFIVSRIKEEHDRGADTRTAVATGIQRSAPLITAAAGILALTFAVYATGSVVFLKELGVGLALAVLVDALLIRAVLLPAVMRLAGDANWWAPAPLRRLHTRFGLTEAAAD
ncbi:MMPL family transporter [Kitasatospora sp. NBC_00458]|uniref:MMPL family transporter n=1 Tax=Kitasatospora sp. NBC_00458 TaxID=2903568 RepID=UPI002E16BD34